LRPGSWRVSCQSGRAFMVQIDVVKYLGHINNAISCVCISQMQKVALTLSAVSHLNRIVNHQAKH
jgi:hypothetical protein